MKKEGNLQRKRGLFPLFSVKATTIGQDDRKEKLLKQKWPTSRRKTRDTPQSGLFAQMEEKKEGLLQTKSQQEQSRVRKEQKRRKEK